MSEPSLHHPTDQPELSVVLTSYNRAECLPQSIESILQQTYQDFELLIVDDCSSDPKVLQCVRHYAQHDARIRIIEKDQNRGIAHSRNLGLHNARGKFLAQIDDDDISHPERLERQITFLKTHPQFAAVGCVLQHFRNELVRNDTTKEALMCYECCLGVNPLGVWCGGATNPSAMFRHEALLAVGGWRTWFPFAEDFDLTLRLIEKYPLAVLGGEPLYYWRKDSGNKLTRTPVAWHYTLAAIISAHLRRLGNVDPIRPEVSLDEVIGLTNQYKLATDARAYMAKATAENICLHLQAGRVSVAWDTFKLFHTLIKDGSRVAVIREASKMILHFSKGLFCAVRRS